MRSRLHRPAGPKRPAAVGRADRTLTRAADTAQAGGEPGASLSPPGGWHVKLTAPVFAKWQVRIEKIKADVEDRLVRAMSPSPVTGLRPPLPRTRRAHSRYTPPPSVTAVRS